MELANKNAVVYGASGAIGGAVARAFAREGANVFLAGRTQPKVDRVAEQIIAKGGTAEPAVVDALDESAVERHADAVAGRAGSIDISFNAVGMDDGDQGVPLAELSADDYVRPIAAYGRTHFLTAKVAARHMVPQGAGVILPLSNPMARTPSALTGPFAQAGAVVENLSRQFAAELGPHGVRVVCLRPHGMPEAAAELGSHTRDVWGRAAERLGVPFEQLLDMVGEGSVRQKPLRVAELAEVAVLAASDRSGALTATTINVTCGAVVD